MPTPSYQPAKVVCTPDVTYHRNGSSGVGFFSIVFDWLDDEGTPVMLRKMIGTMFVPPCGDMQECEHYSVVDRLDPSACFAASHFMELMSRAVRQYKRDLDLRVGIRPADPKGAKARKKNRIPLATKVSPITRAKRAAGRRSTRAKRD